MSELHTYQIGVGVLASIGVHGETYTSQYILLNLNILVMDASPCKGSGQD